MRRNLLLASGIIFALYLMVRDQDRFEEQRLEGHDNGNARAEEMLPVVEPTKHLATDVLDEEEHGEAGASKVTAPSEEAAVPAFFPKARVVASVTEPAEHGQSRVIETVETTMRERYVRVERVLSPSSTGGAHVTSEVAMVANQLLLKKPAGMAGYMFLDLLGRAGAVHVKELGDEAYLATFQARPTDPKALDVSLARVQELAGVDITAEPNYIRKIF